MQVYKLDSTARFEPPRHERHAQAPLAIFFLHQQAAAQRDVDGFIFRRWLRFAFAESGEIFPLAW
jgi:hypothetical protein